MAEPSPAQAHPLIALEGIPLGGYRLRLTRLDSERKAGWKRFRLSLAGPGGRESSPVVEGVYSPGGRGVQPWIEVLRYAPAPRVGDAAVDLREAGLERALFEALSAIVPEGGHIMVGCEDAVHADTHRALLKGAPAVATPLGVGLFEAGFRKVKFFYLAEGGWEGQQKLWAEKPLGAAMAKDWDRATAAELERFLARAGESGTLAPSRALAARLLQELRA